MMSIILTCFGESHKIYPKIDLLHFHIFLFLLLKQKLLNSLQLCVELLLLVVYPKQHCPYKKIQFIHTFIEYCVMK